MRPTHLVRLSALLLGGALLAAPARAAEPDKYLPDDANFVMTLDVRGLVEAPLVQKHVPELAVTHGLDLFDFMCKANPGFEKLYGDYRGLFKRAFADKEFTEEMLSQMGKAVSSYAVAGSTDGPDRMLILMRGDFDADDVKGHLLTSAKLFAIPMKNRTVGARDLFELSVPGMPDPMYVLVPEKGVLVATPVEDYALAAADKADGKKDLSLKKEVQAALEKVDGKQTLWLCAVAPPGDPIKQFSGGLTIAKDVKFVFALSARDAATAAAVARAFNDAAEEFKGGLADLARSYKPLLPLSDAFKALKAEARGGVVTAKLTISEAAINKAVK